MKGKNDVEVLINGRKYTLCGYESSEYLQKVASYINSKYTELKSQPYYSSLDLDLKNVLLAINIADDYFKAHKQANDLENDTELKDKMIFDMKHEMISCQTKLSESEKKYNQCKSENEELQKQLIKLQTELNEKNKTRRNG